MRDEEILRLTERERVVWDYIDRVPPPARFVASIVSTRAAGAALNLTGTVLHIPHHHCNYERVFTRAKPDAVTWIGHKLWYPGPLGLNESAFFVENSEREHVATCYRSSGLLLNTRLQSEATVSHVKFNSGIKLINAIGFAIPSISLCEPAYVEIAESKDCTVFSEEANVVSDVLELLANSERYRQLQQQCLSLSEEYHIDTIVRRYRRKLASL